MPTHRRDQAASPLKIDASSRTLRQLPIDHSRPLADGVASLRTRREPTLNLSDGASVVPHESDATLGTRHGSESRGANAPGRAASGPRDFTG
jgi:hypothetical protein